MRAFKNACLPAGCLVYWAYLTCTFINCCATTKPSEDRLSSQQNTRNYFKNINMTTAKFICDGVCTAVLSGVSEICEMLVNICACGAERHDQDVAADRSTELGEEGVRLSVEETGPAGTQQSVRPFFSTDP